MKTFGYLFCGIILLGFPNLMFAQIELSEGLVAYYPFNGNARDESEGTPARHDGIATGAVLAKDRFERENSCYEFNGTSDYIRTVAFSSGLPASNRSVSLWFHPNELVRTQNYEALLGYGGNGCATAFYIAINRNRVLIHSHCSGTGASADAQFTSDRWHHLVVTVSSNAVAFYLDGVLLASREVAFDTTYVVERSLYIGAGVGGDGVGPFDNPDVTLFRGRIDDVRIYDRPLSRSEVVSLYRAEQVGQEMTLAIDVLTVRVTMFVNPGERYQLRASSNLKDWINVDTSFVAASAVLTRDIEVIDIGQYFQIHKVDLD